MKSWNLLCIIENKLLHLWNKTKRDEEDFISVFVRRRYYDRKLQQSKYRNTLYKTFAQLNRGVVRHRNIHRRCLCQLQMEGNKQQRLGYYPEG